MKRSAASTDDHVAPGRGFQAALWPQPTPTDRETGQFHRASIYAQRADPQPAARQLMGYSDDGYRELELQDRVPGYLVALLCST